MTNGGPLRLLFGSVALVALALGAPYACSGGSTPTNLGGGGGGGGGNPPPSGNTTSIDMKNTAYSPRVDTVAAGETVTWTNQDGFHHTVTADNGSFDSGEVLAGNTYRRTFSQTGSYPYHCAYHGSPGSGMYGVLVVK